MAEIAIVTDALRAWIADAYEVWWVHGADRVHGGFHERLSHDAAPTGEARRARLQPRQMFAYAHALQLGWMGPSSTAVEHALAFFISRYRRDDGLFRRLVAPTGEPLSEDVVLYDQAFALLGLASAYAAVRDVRLPGLAADLHDRLRQRLSHPSIGFHESLDRRLPLSSNSHMHLLEASLAWQDVDADERWSRLTHELVELATTRLIDSRTGAVRELFDVDWQAARGDSGGSIEPGHLFEWAWLLLRCRARIADDRLASNALRMIEIGEAYGVDRARYVAINALDTELRARDLRARLWPQCERIKAACIALEATGEVRYCSIAIEATQALMRYLDTPLRGLWRDSLGVSGAFIQEPAPASSFYHIVGAALELSRVAPSVSQQRGSPMDCPQAGGGPVY